MRTMSITKVYRFPDHKNFIYKKELASDHRHETFFVYSANGLDRWHINPQKAWDDFHELPEVYECLKL